MEQGEPSLSVESLLEHTGWLEALARRLVGVHEADDLVQETWAQAIRRPPSKGGWTRAWLARVAVHLAIDRSRRSARRRAREARAAQRGTPPRKPEEVLEQAELQALLAAEVLRLPSSIRMVILLHFVEGSPPQQIAEQLNLSVGSVRKRIHRGLETLRKSLEQRYRGTWRDACFLLIGGADRGAPPSRSHPKVPVLGVGAAAKLMMVAGVLVSLGLILAWGWRAGSAGPPAETGALGASLGNTPTRAPATPSELLEQRDAAGPRSVSAELRADGEPVRRNGVLWTTGFEAGGPRSLGFLSGRFPCPEEWELDPTRAELPASERFRVEWETGPSARVKGLEWDQGPEGPVLVLDLGRPSQLRIQALDLAGNPVAGALVRIGDPFFPITTSAWPRTDQGGWATPLVYGDGGPIRIRVEAETYAHGWAVIEPGEGVEAQVYLPRVLACAAIRDPLLPCPFQFGFRSDRILSIGRSNLSVERTLAKLEQRAGVPPDKEVWWFLVSERNGSWEEVVIQLYYEEDGPVRDLVLRPLASPELTWIELPQEEVEPRLPVRVHFSPRDAFGEEPPALLSLVFEPAEGPGSAPAGAETVAQRRSRLSGFQLVETGQRVADGSYLFHLPPGDYTLHGGGPALGVLSMPAFPSVELSAAFPTDVAVEVEEATSYREVCFLDSDGFPIEFDGKIRPEGLDPPGRSPFRMDRGPQTVYLTPGDYRVWAIEETGPVEGFDLVVHYPTDGVLAEGVWWIPCPADGLQGVSNEAYLRARGYAERYTAWAHGHDLED